jgi:tripartite-type tricarboxylate transporter receptor subunit TctC
VRLTLRLLFFSCVWLAAQSVATAQEFPVKPVTLVIPFSPGGNTDVIGRVVADKMSTFLGQRVLVENRPGAGGAVGAAYVARAKPDGYTLLGYGGAALVPAFVKNINFDMMKDFTPVGRTHNATMILLTSAANPAGTSIKNLVAYAKSNPGKLTLGAASNLTRAGGIYFARTLGFEAPLILYKGSADVAAALARGEIDAAIDGTNPSARAQISTGKVRGLAILSSHKNYVFPDVSTVVELGMPELVEPSSSGIWAPANTPREVILKLNRALNEALKDPMLQETIRQSGHQPTPGTPEEFRRGIQEESKFWSDAAIRAGIEPE